MCLRIRILLEDSKKEEENLYAEYLKFFENLPFCHGRIYIVFYSLAPSLSMGE